ncbi:MAG: bifunctional 2-polyprenyl-6-hydroxyphenol methylase/3-demethylubiquinol 3-O-methyltransferase UbiG [Rhodospirillales bacterium]|nr:MAG: bifunctional 2-polyprenyl-6-hydroxyphenol methylase/3-demethylubiquinol 3-O-methyltransferase UbiG [Rhodospirillales bacterium]
MLKKDQIDSPWPESGTVDPKQIERFEKLAEEWWKPEGKFRVAHKFNAVRRDYLVSRIARHFGRNPGNEDTLSGVRILDVGCGAGLFCEPLAKRGAEVVGIDPTARNIEIARWHAAQEGLSIEYRHGLAEHVVATGERFDVVVNAEVVEHVADPQQLMKDCGDLVKPGGLLLVATLNRTARAFLLAIVGAEYVLRWLPKGTHEWHRFLRPDEIRGMLRRSGLRTTEIVGVSYSPIADRWRLSRDTGVNFMLLAAKEAK